MTISFLEFMKQLFTHPTFALVSILVMGTIFVNGWTDAPNAIASCVSTKAMELDKAIRMAAVFNFAGLLFMTTFNTKVAFTMWNMVDLGANKESALLALCAALATIIVWACIAFLFGIPTSESHGLIAALTGAAIAIRGGLVGVRLEEWKKILVGLFLSVLVGYIGGAVITRIVRKWNTRRKVSVLFFRKAQIAGGAAMAFMHGAQDGQKFMGVFMLAIFLVMAWQESGNFKVPFWMMVVASILMASGTALGGKRIIQKVGKDMVQLEGYQGFASDIAAALCLFIFSVKGIPVSTTHVKTTAMMGAGSIKGESSLNRKIVIEMAIAWILTFPCCAAMGYLMSKIIIHF